jgi:hypothetical protein
LGLICWNISLVHNGLSHMAMTHGLVLKETWSRRFYFMN